MFIVIDQIEAFYATDYQSTLLSDLAQVGDIGGARHITICITGSSPMLHALCYNKVLQNAHELAMKYPRKRVGLNDTKFKFYTLLLLASLHAVRQAWRAVFKDGVPLPENEDVLVQIELKCRGRVRELMSIVQTSQELGCLPKEPLPFAQPHRAVQFLWDQVKQQLHLPDFPIDLLEKCDVITNVRIPYQKFADSGISYQELYDLADSDSDSGSLVFDGHSVGFAHLSDVLHCMAYCDTPPPAAAIKALERMSLLYSFNIGEQDVNEA